MHQSKRSYVFTIEEFFSGRLYPAIVCLLVLSAQIFSLEHIIIPVIVLLVSASLMTSRSIKPLIAPLCSFVYTLSLKNAVFGAESSDYYFTGWRLVAIFLLGALLIVSFAVFICRNGLIRRLAERKTPGLIPLLLFCGTLPLGGIFSGYWHPKNLLIALAQIAAYLIVYLLFFHGFSDGESSEELADYFAYICALITVVIAAELLAVYLTNDVLQDGVIDRSKIQFGWGVCNTVGINANILIPLNFYAAYRSKKHCAVYFALAVLAYLTSIFSISRNGLVVGGVIFLLCIILFSFFGNKKRLFCIFSGILALIVIAGFLIFREPISTAFEDYLNRGFTDEGRFELWGNAIRHFLENPIFGNGFKAPLLFGEGIGSFMPLMAHNTILELLFATGLVGIICYIIYRASTLIPFVKRPSVMKSALGLLILTLLLASMLDNFAFHIHPVFYYSIAMAIVQRDCAKDVSCERMPHPAK